MLFTVENRSTVVSQLEASQIVQALNQWLPTVARGWQLPCPLVLLGNNQEDSEDNVRTSLESHTRDETNYFFIVDQDSDIEHVVSSHELTHLCKGLVVAQSFLKEAKNSPEHSAYVSNGPAEETDCGMTVGVALGHELANHLVDPAGNLWHSWSRTEQAGPIVVARDICNPVYASNIPIHLSSGIMVTMPDFVLPAWFEDGTPGPFNFKKTLSRPHECGSAGVLLGIRGAGDKDGLDLFAQTTTSADLGGVLRTFRVRKRLKQLVANVDAAVSTLMSHRCPLPSATKDSADDRSAELATNANSEANPQEMNNLISVAGEQEARAEIYCPAVCSERSATHDYEPEIIEGERILPEQTQDLVHDFVNTLLFHAAQHAAQDLTSDSWQRDSKPWSMTEAPEFVFSVPFLPSGFEGDFKIMQGDSKREHRGSRSSRHRHKHEHEPSPKHVHADSHHVHTTSGNHSPHHKPSHSPSSHHKVEHCEHNSRHRQDKQLKASRLPVLKTRPGSARKDGQEQVPSKTREPLKTRNAENGKSPAKSRRANGDKKQDKAPAPTSGASASRVPKTKSQSLPRAPRVPHNCGKKHC
jgi:hypothetical protein